MIRKSKTILQHVRTTNCVLWCWMLPKIKSLLGKTFKSLTLCQEERRAKHCFQNLTAPKGFRQIGFLVWIFRTELRLRGWGVGGRDSWGRGGKSPTPPPSGQCLGNIEIPNPFKSHLATDIAKHLKYKIQTVTRFMIHNVCCTYYVSLKGLVDRF